jgi:hypothetical protein
MGSDVLLQDMCLAKLARNASIGKRMLLLEVRFQEHLGNIVSTM